MSSRYPSAAYPLPGALAPILRPLAGPLERRPHLGAALGGLFCGLIVLLVLGLHGSGGEEPLRARRVLTAASMVGLLLLPLISLAGPGRPAALLAGAAWDVAVSGARAGGWLAALAIYALLWDRGALLALAALAIYAAVLSASTAAAIRAGGYRAVSRTVVAAVGVALYAAPFWTRPVIDYADGSPGLIRSVAGASPLAVAETAWLHASGVAVYHVQIQTRMYGIWIGNDYLLTIPPWWAVSLLWLLAAAACWTAAGLLARKKRNTGR